MAVPSLPAPSRPSDEGIARNPCHQHYLHPHAPASRLIT